MQRVSGQAALLTQARMSANMTLQAVRPCRGSSCRPPRILPHTFVGHLAAFVAKGCHNVPPLDTCRLSTGTGDAPGVVLHIPCSLTIYERLCVAVGDKDDSGSILSFTCLSVFNSSASWPAFQGSIVSPVLRCTNRSAWA